MTQTLVCPPTLTEYTNPWNISKSIKVLNFHEAIRYKTWWSHQLIQIDSLIYNILIYFSISSNFTSINQNIRGPIDSVKVQC